MSVRIRIPHPSDQLNRDQWREIASILDVPGRGRMIKRDLVKACTEAASLEVGEPTDPIARLVDPADLVSGQDQGAPASLRAFPEVDPDAAGNLTLADLHSGAVDGDVVVDLVMDGEVVAEGLRLEPLHQYRTEPEPGFRREALDAQLGLSHAQERDLRLEAQRRAPRLNAVGEPPDTNPLEVPYARPRSGIRPPMKGPWGPRPPGAQYPLIGRHNQLRVTLRGPDGGRPEGRRYVLPDGSWHPISRTGRVLHGIRVHP